MVLERLLKNLGTDGDHIDAGYTDEDINFSNLIYMPRRRYYGGSYSESLEQLRLVRPPLQPLGQIVRSAIPPGSLIYSEMMVSGYPEQRPIQMGKGRRRHRQKGRGPAYVDRYGQFIHNY